MWTRRVDQQKGLCPRAFERIGPGGRDAIEVLSLTTTLLCCLMLYPVVGKIINKDVKKMRFHSGMFFQAAPLHTQKKYQLGSPYSCEWLWKGEKQVKKKKKGRAR